MKGSDLIWNTGCYPFIRRQKSFWLRCFCTVHIIRQRIGRALCFINICRDFDIRFDVRIAVNAEDVNLNYAITWNRLMKKIGLWSMDFKEFAFVVNALCRWADRGGYLLFIQITWGQLSEFGIYLLLTRLFRLPTQGTSCRWVRMRGYCTFFTETAMLL